jgi:hypothetical protein
VRPVLSTKWPAVVCTKSGGVGWPVVGDIEGIRGMLDGAGGLGQDTTDGSNHLTSATGMLSSYRRAPGQ